MKIMHTMASDSRTKVSKRRFYSADLKCQVVAQCGQPGASIAAVALGHGINANIVHRWIREHGQGALAATSPAFIPVTLNEVPRQAAVPVQASPPEIRIEVQRANASVVVHWPLQGGAACAQWLREWLA